MSNIGNNQHFGSVLFDVHLFFGKVGSAIILSSFVENFFVNSLRCYQNFSFVAAKISLMREPS